MPNRCNSRRDQLPEPDHWTKRRWRRRLKYGTDSSPEEISFKLRVVGVAMLLALGCFVILVLHKYSTPPTSSSDPASMLDAVLNALTIALLVFGPIYIGWWLWDWNERRLPNNEERITDPRTIRAIRRQHQHDAEARKTAQRLENGESFHVGADGEIVFDHKSGKHHHQESENE